MKKRLFTGILCMFSIMAFSGCEKPPTQKSLPGPQDKIHSVSVTQVLIKDIPNVFELKGNFTTTQRLSLKSEFNGKVQGLNVLEGQSVAAGDTLFKIEDEKLPWILDRQKAELKEAEAQLELENRLSDPAEDEEALARMRDLQQEQAELREAERDARSAEEDLPEPPKLPNGTEGESETDNNDSSLEAKRRAVISAMRNRYLNRNLPAPQATQQPVAPVNSNPEQAESRIAVAQAKVDRIKTEIALTEKQISGGTILAPFDGFVAKLNVREGAVVKTDDLLAELVDVDPIELTLQVPKDQIAKINKSGEVKVEATDLPDKTFKGEITFVGAELDPKTQTVELRVKVANPGLAIKVGMQGNAKFGTATASHQAMLVPLESVLSRGNQKVVYTFRGNVAREQEVEVGANFEKMIEIKSGLQSSDQVVTQGIEQLSEKEEFVKLLNF